MIIGESKSNLAKKTKLFLVLNISPYIGKTEREGDWVRDAKRKKRKKGREREREKDGGREREKKKDGGREWERNGEGEIYSE